MLPGVWQPEFFAQPATPSFGAPTPATLVAQTALPTFAKLLGLAHITAQPGMSYHAALSALFNWQNAPLAALRALADGLDARQGFWLCADPVNISYQRETLMLSDSQSVGLVAAECMALAKTLAPHFAEYGELHSPHPQRWYLRLHQVTQAQFHAPETAAGRNLLNWLPQGNSDVANQEARVWRRILTESQTLLHDHPVNSVREQRGQLLANSVWFWGPGQLDDANHPSASQQIATNPISTLPAPTHVLTDEPLAQGFALGRQRTLLPIDSALPAHANSVLVSTLAQRAAQQLDIGDWQTALLKLEQTVFAPALHALKQGDIKRLVIMLPGEHGSLQCQIERADLWKFWRRPMTLATLAKRFAPTQS